MLDTADRTPSDTLSQGHHALVDVTLARIGPPYGRVLADEEYARLLRHLRLLGCGEPAISARAGEVLHEWTIDGRVRLRMYSCQGQQGWVSVE